MVLTPLHLLLPNDKTISLEVGREDTLHVVLQELIFFEMLPKQNEGGTTIAYCFLDQGSGEKLLTDQVVSALARRENGPVYLMIAYDDSDPTRLIKIHISLPSKEVVDIELPLAITGEEIIQTLRDNDLLSEKQNEQVLRYQLESKRMNETFYQQSLHEVGVQNGEQLKITIRNTIFVGVLLKKDAELIEIDVEKYGTDTVNSIWKDLIHHDILSPPNHDEPPYIHTFRIANTDQIVKKYQTLDELGIEDGDKIDLQVDVRETPWTEDTVVSLLIQPLDTKQEIPIEFPLSTTGSELVIHLLKINIVPQFDSSGNLISYRLVNESTGQEISGNQRLLDANIEDEDVLIIIPNLLAGGNADLGRILISFPDQFYFVEKNYCRFVVRISPQLIKKRLLKKGLSTESKIHKIEISKVMEVSLEENSLEPILRIKPHNTIDQYVANESWTEWNFDVIATNPGLTSLIVKVSMLVKVLGFGMRRKTVFFLDHELEILAPENLAYIPTFRTVTDDIQQFLLWRPELKIELISLISEAQTGKALAQFANVVQDQDEALFHSLIMLQSQWNDSKNRLARGLITQESWTITQNQINETLLHLLADIEKRQQLQASTVRAHIQKLDKVRAIAEKAS